MHIYGPFDPLLPPPDTNTTTWLVFVQFHEPRCSHSIEGRGKVSVTKFGCPLKGQHFRHKEALAIYTQIERYIENSLNGPTTGLLSLFGKELTKNPCLQCPRVFMDDKWAMGAHLCVFEEAFF